MKLKHKKYFWNFIVTGLITTVFLETYVIFVTLKHNKNSLKKVWNRIQQQYGQVNQDRHTGGSHKIITIIDEIVNAVPKRYVKKTITATTTKSSMILKELNLKCHRFNEKKDTFIFMNIPRTNVHYWQEYLYTNLQIKLIAANTTKNACRFVDLKTREYTCPRTKLSPDSFIWNSRLNQSCPTYGDYNELNNCIGKYGPSSGKFHFMTFLRNPIERYLSEFENLKFKSQYDQSIRKCNDQTEQCFTRIQLKSNLTIDQFISCETNLANNRQVRMLANLTKLGCNVLKCFSKSNKCSLRLKHDNEISLLESAKETLLNMEFFGITQYQVDSKNLFEKIYGRDFSFRQDIKQLKDDSFNLAKYFKYIKRITSLNSLDIKLFDFALDLFSKRLNKMKVDNVNCSQ